MSDLVYLVVRRKKRSIFLETPSATNIAEIKKMLEGIIKVPTYNQRLYLNMDGELEMEDDKDLEFYGQNFITIINQLTNRQLILFSAGVTSAISKPASPVYLGLCIKIEDGSFEPMLIIPYSVPPEFADVMKMVPPATNTEPIEANNLTIQNEEMPPPDQN